MEVRRLDVVLVSLDPTLGHEINKTRPCVVVSPDEMNRYSSTLLVAPMTTAQRRYPTRVPCIFEGRAGQIVLDQMRAIDRARIIRKLGSLSDSDGGQLLRVLGEMFAP